MLKPHYFKFPYQYFHLNFELEVFPLFKFLDWRFICHNLNKCQERWKKLELHAVVMMDTHTHVLFRLPEQNENFFTKYLLELLGEKCPGEVLVEPIKNYSQYLNTYKYIYRNPVEAGVELMCETYPYSSLHGLLGLGPHQMTILDPMGAIQNPRHILNWLNSDKNYKDSKLKDLRQDNSFLM